MSNKRDMEKGSAIKNSIIEDIDEQELKHIVNRKSWKVHDKLYNENYSEEEEKDGESGRHE